MHLAPAMAERIGIVTVRARLPQAGYRTPVPEAARLGVMLLELTVGTGLRHSRITYMTVPSRSLP